MSADATAGITAMLDQAHAARAHWLRHLDAATVPIDPSQSSWANHVCDAMLAASHNGQLECCVHISTIQPYAVLAEEPTVLLCTTCYEKSGADRSCHLCGTPTGTASLYGGLEYRAVGVGALYSRQLCPSCATRADRVRPGGTFGAPV
ncbi:hypothetical protein [Kitasatospora sp. NPDC058046]|uniref:hypothetical protein n=1 Tax=Kitasatospora sp. NPDC058046 TaxID=3346312 RepID=UPI0036D7803E